jgi:hypothetical protein
LSADFRTLLKTRNKRFIATSIFENYKKILKQLQMEKLTILFDTPQKMASELTDNPQLQDFLETFLSIKNLDERKAYESRFWSKVMQFPSSEQAAIRASNERISQRLSEKMSHLAPDSSLSFNRNGRAVQQ